MTSEPTKNEIASETPVVEGHGERNDLQGDGNGGHNGDEPSANGEDAPTVLDVPASVLSSVRNAGLSEPLFYLGGLERRNGEPPEEGERPAREPSSLKPPKRDQGR